MKKIAIIIGTLFVFITMGSHAVAKTTLKLATITPDHHAYGQGAREFARLVKERTNGEVVVKVYTGGQLGKGERELLESMQLGLTDLAITATGPVSNFSQEMGVVDLPFLFTSNAHADRHLDGDVGDDLMKSLEKNGIKGLAFFENGFRNFTSKNTPLLTPEDFKGLKFRTMENPVHLKSVRQLGAKAVPMSWSEVYTSMQTGVIDGHENSIGIIYAFKINEVQKKLSMTGHFYSPAPLTMSLRKFNKLTPEHQDIVLQSAKDAAVFERKIIRENERKELKQLEAGGMEISYPDKAPFMEAMQPVYDYYADKYPSWKGILERIQADKNQ